MIQYTTSFKCFITVHFLGIWQFLYTELVFVNDNDLHLSIIFGSTLYTHHGSNVTKYCTFVIYIWQAYPTQSNVCKQARVYPRLKHLSYASGLTHKHMTRLQSHARDKNSGLLQTFVNYRRNCLYQWLLVNLLMVFHSRGRLLAFPTNVRFGWKCLAPHQRTMPQCYLPRKKSFVPLVPRTCTIKLFTVVIYGFL